MSRIIKSSQVKIIHEKKIVKSETSQCIENEKKRPLEAKYDHYDEEREKISKEIQALLLKKEDILKEVEIVRENGEKEKKEMIDRAKIEYENIISGAKEEAKKLLEENKKIGYEQGYNEGYNKSINEYNSLVQQALETKKSILNWKKDEINKLETDLIHLALDSIEKIIRIKLQEDDYLILNILKEGLNKFTFTQSLVIRVSSEDFDIVNFSKDKILAMADQIDQMEIKVDNSIQKGDVIIDTSSGSINPSVTNQINILKEEFSKLLQSGDKT